MNRILIIALFAFFISGQTQASNNSIESQLAAFLNGGNLDGILEGSERHTITIWPFDGNNRYDARNTLSKAVVNGVRAAGRFEVIEREKLDYIIEQIDIVKDIKSSKAEELISQGHLKGAEYILFGYVNFASVDRTSHEYKGKTSYSYKAKTSLNIRIVDVETGNIKISETLTEDASISIKDSGDTKADAWSSLCKNMRKKIKGFIKSRFPMSVQIVNIESKKNGKAFEVLIDKGSKRGINKNDEVKVYEIIKMEMGGKTREREKELATMVVKKVEGQDFSVCRVKKGGDKLLKKLNDGSPIKCRVYGKRDIFSLW